MRPDTLRAYQKQHILLHALIWRGIFLKVLMAHMRVHPVILIRIKVTTRYSHVVKYYFLRQVHVERLYHTDFRLNLNSLSNLHCHLEFFFTKRYVLYM